MAQDLKVLYTIAEGERDSVNRVVVTDEAAAPAAEANEEGVQAGCRKPPDVLLHDALCLLDVSFGCVPIVLVVLDDENDLANSNEQAVLVVGGEKKDSIRDNKFVTSLQGGDQDFGTYVHAKSKEEQGDKLNLDLRVVRHLRGEGGLERLEGGE